MYGLGEQTNRLYAFAALLGLLSHVLYFVHGTIHGREVPRIALLHAVAWLLLFISHAVATHSILHGLASASLLSTCYLVALFGSMTTYRLLVHRTRRFPGPLAAKVTKFYGAWLNRHSRMHEKHIRLADRYGDFVRIGPNELLVRHVDAVAAVHGARSPCTKGPVYDNLELLGEPNLDGIVDRQAHRARRRVWERAIGGGRDTMAVYEERARETARDWLGKLRELGATGAAGDAGGEEEEGKKSCKAGVAVVDTSLFSLLISFDNMGRVGFSREWGLVRAGKENRLLHLIEVLFGSIALLGSSLNWPVPLLKALGVDPRQREFEKLVQETARERAEVGVFGTAERPPPSSSCRPWLWISDIGIG